MTHRPLPTLAQFIGNGTRAEDFEQFEAYVRDLMVAYPDATGDTKRLVRFMRAFSLAAVEVARQEGDGTGTTALEVCHSMLQGGTVAMASAVLSIVSEDIPAELFRDFIVERVNTALDEIIRVNSLK